MNVLELQAAIKKRGIPMNRFLDLVRITPSSWSRRVKGTSEMTLAEIQRIVDTLNLSEEEVKEIFF